MMVPKATLHGAVSGRKLKEIPGRPKGGSGDRMNQKVLIGEQQGSQGSNGFQEILQASKRFTQTCIGVPKRFNGISTGYGDSKWVLGVHRIQGLQRGFSWFHGHLRRSFESVSERFMDVSKNHIQVSFQGLSRNFQRRFRGTQGVAEDFLRLHEVFKRFQAASTKREKHKHPTEAEQTRIKCCLRFVNRALSMLTISIKSQKD